MSSVRMKSREGEEVQGKTRKISQFRFGDIELMKWHVRHETSRPFKISLAQTR
jgi:hypothetical protein